MDSWSPNIHWTIQATTSGEFANISALTTKRTATTGIVGGSFLGSDTIVDATASKATVDLTGNWWGQDGFDASPEPVSAADVPEQNAGRLLSDEWVETALEEADRRDHYDEELVAAARDAYDDSTLDRELVVVQDRTDGGTFDESVAELPIDSVEILKGAPKLD